MSGVDNDDTYYIMKNMKNTNKPEFYRFTVYNIHPKLGRYNYAIAEVFARDEVEARELWEEEVPDDFRNLHNVDIVYEKVRQSPNLRIFWNKLYNPLTKPKPSV